MTLLALATVTGDGRPLVGPVKVMSPARTNPDFASGEFHTASASSTSVMAPPSIAEGSVPHIRRQPRVERGQLRGVPTLQRPTCSRHAPATLLLGAKGDTLGYGTLSIMRANSGNVMPLSGARWDRRRREALAPPPLMIVLSWLASVR